MPTPGMDGAIVDAAADAAADASATPDAQAPDAQAPEPDAGQDASLDAGDEPDAGPLERSLIEVPVDVSDFVVDPARRRIYASAAPWSADETQRNKLFTISDRGEVLDDRVIGERPESLALSDDGTTLWVSLEGTHELRRIDVSGPAPVPGEKFPTPKHDQGWALHARSLVVLPGTTGSVAISLHSDNSPSLEGVAIVDHGVERANRGPRFAGGAQLMARANGDLFGADRDLYGLDVDATGVVEQTQLLQVTRGGAFNYDPDGFVLFSYGDVFDVRDEDAVTHAGFIPVVGSITGLPDSDIAISISPLHSTQPAPLMLSKIDTSTFTILSTEPLTTESATSWPVSNAKLLSDTALVFHAVGPGVSHLFIFHDPKLASAPEPTESAVTPIKRGELVHLPIEAKAVVRDPVRPRVYAVARSSAEAFPNRLITIDGDTGALLHSVWVGSEPTALAIADDGSTLWVALAGSYELRRIDLTGDVPSLGASMPIPLILAEHADPQQLVVLRGETDVVALTTRRLDGGGGSQGLALFEHGGAHVTTHTDWQVLDLQAGPAGVLFGISAWSPYDLVTLEVSSSEPYFIAHTSVPSWNGAFVHDGEDTLYFGSGAVVDVSTPATPIERGNLSSVEGRTAPFLAEGAILVLDCVDNAPILRAFDPGSLAQVAERPIDSGEPSLCVHEINQLMVSGPETVMFVADLSSDGGSLYRLTGLDDFFTQVQRANR